METIKENKIMGEKFGENKEIKADGIFIADFLEEYKLPKEEEKEVMKKVKNLGIGRNLLIHYSHL